MKINNEGDAFSSSRDYLEGGIEYWKEKLTSIKHSDIPNGQKNNQLEKIGSDYGCHHETN